MLRSASLRRAAPLVLLLPLLVQAPAAATTDDPEPDALQRQFAVAAERQHVPQSVLLAVSYLESRWDAHGGAPSVTGGYGPMHLTDVVTALAGAGHHADGTEDARGDDARAPRTGEGAAARA
ncbi:N-acetylmuramoyl-L-alanine amidase, partial [Streptomyces sp. NPDC004787]